MNNRTTQRCLFCGIGKVTKEHAIAESWGSILDGGLGDIPGHTLWYVHRIFEPTGSGSGLGTNLVKEKRAKTPAFKSRHFCGDCQGDWMRKLDESVRDLIARLRPTASLAIPVDCQHRLACWTIKTMLVFLSMEPAERQSEFGVIPDYLRFGQAREPLPEAHVWIGASQNDQPGWFRSASLDLHPSGGPDGRAYAAGLGISNLFALAIVPSSPDFRLRLGEKHTPAMRRIWPMRAKPLGWPPVVQITTRDLDRVFDAMTRSAVVTARSKGMSIGPTG